MYSYVVHMQQFAADWERIQTQQHVVIHLPSLGFSKKIRQTEDLLALYENVQVGRVCEISGANARRSSTPFSLSSTSTCTSTAALQWNSFRRK